MKYVLFILCGMGLALGQGPGWELTFSDEFDGAGVPDASKWDRPEYNRRNNDAGPDGWWLQEDSYLDGSGNLVIRVKKIANRNADTDAFDYSCGAIRTRGHFQQALGRFEIRCQLPSQPGWWVAFWLYADGVGNVDNSGEDGTEIDIFEGFGWTHSINQALHWDGYGTAHKSTGKRTTIPGIRTGYHDFVLEWDSLQYVFLVDGQETWRTDSGGVSKVPEYVKVTAEISTESWAINEYWSNDPAMAVYPDSFLVDYVRVYRRNTASQNSGPLKGARPAALEVCPNPFNVSAGIRVTLPAPADADLSVFDPAGKRVAILHHGAMRAGESSFAWDGRKGRTGIYLVRLKSGTKDLAKRILLVR